MIPDWVHSDWPARMRSAMLARRKRLRRFYKRFLRQKVQRD